MSMPAKDRIFGGGRFKVDAEKNMYKMTDNGYTLMQKLDRPIYELIVYDDKAYCMDTFGDCYVIDDGVSFLFGILSNPLYFTAKNDRIYALDKYSRMWVYDMEGEVLNVSFLKEGICSVVVKESYCLVTTDGNTLAIDYGRSSDGPRKERKAIICDRSFTVLKEMEIDRIVEAGDSFISYDASGRTGRLCIQSLWKRMGNEEKGKSPLDDQNGPDSANCAGDSHSF